MIVKLLAEHHLEFLSLKGGCRGSSEYTLVKMSNCWKSHATAINLFILHSVMDIPVPPVASIQPKAFRFPQRPLDFKNTEQRIV